jgi:molybdopterin/thiamine biosynthesis adenylyltransferase
MKEKDYITSPKGTRIKKGYSKLKHFIADQLSSAEVPQHIYDFAARKSTFENSGGQVDYSTADFEMAKLGGFPILQVGAGSGGGHTGKTLDPAGLIYTVIDPKKVEAKHVEEGRTIYTAHEIGMYKVDAFKKILERDNPGTKVNPLPFDLGEIPDHSLKDMIATAALVIIAIDDPVQILRINDLGYSLTEMLQIANHRNADSGHVAIVIPGITSCLRCTLNITEDQQIRRLDSEPAASVDIITTSQMAAKIALEILYAKVTGRTIKKWNPSKNLLFIANKSQELSPDGPGLIWEQSQKKSNCPICNS